MNNRKLKTNPQIRRRDIADNQWLSKWLFGELPFSDKNLAGEYFKLEIEQRPDGIVYRPVRVTIFDIEEQLTNFLSEGNSASEYLASNIFDEEDSLAVYAPEDIFDEGSASTVY
jgi:hypothetical protein